MLKKLGYEVTVFEKKSILSLSDMNEVIAGSERDCSTLGCKTECSTTCNECSSGCYQGPTPEW